MQQAYKPTKEVMKISILTMKKRKTTWTDLKSMRKERNSNASLRRKLKKSSTSTLTLMRYLSYLRKNYPTSQESPKFNNSTQDLTNVTLKLAPISKSLLVSCIQDLRIRTKRKRLLQRLHLAKKMTNRRSQQNGQIHPNLSSLIRISCSLKRPKICKRTFSQ